MKLLIVASSQVGHMGSYLASAAKQLNLDYRIIDANSAEARSRIGRMLYWHLRGKRPARLDRFCEEVVDTCTVMRPDIVLTTGRAPLDRSHILKLRGLGAKLINYSTDDPWNPGMCAPYFLSTIPLYDVIFTPRRANIDDFHHCGVHSVHYLPFAYDPEIHQPWPADIRAGMPSD